MWLVKYQRLEEASLSGHTPTTRWSTLLRAKALKVETQTVYFSFRFSPHCRRHKSTNTSLGSGSRDKNYVSSASNLSLTRQIILTAAAAAAAAAEAAIINMYQAVTVCQTLC